MLKFDYWNVDSAILGMTRAITKNGVRRKTNGGWVYEFPESVTTTWKNPTQLISICPLRDANPFFHFFEFIWMMAGRQDAEWLNTFLPDFEDRYAEENGLIHDAYGNRWINHFDFNQLDTVYETLSHDSSSRQAVISMWDPKVDNGSTKTRPCNTQIYFRITSEDKLDMMVTCRSNDVIWGAYGANAAHFSELHMYMAARLKIAIGRYDQVSFNFHAYEDVLGRLSLRYGNEDIDTRHPYPMPDSIAVNYIHGMWSYPEKAHMEAQKMIAGLASHPLSPYESVFHTLDNKIYRETASVMWRMWVAWKNNGELYDHEYNFAEADACKYDHSAGWIYAGEQWIKRRLK
jgi:hypothetical protein